MLSWALCCVLAVVCNAERTLAHPLYSGTDMEPWTDVFQRLEPELEEAENMNVGKHHQIKAMHPFLPQLDNGKNTWMNGQKYHLKQEKFNNMEDDIKTMLLKLAAAGSLATHGFLHSHQRLPSVNKRGCFWKYCVTN